MASTVKAVRLEYLIVNVRGKWGVRSTVGPAGLSPAEDLQVKEKVERNHC